MRNHDSRAGTELRILETGVSSIFPDLLWFAETHRRNHCSRPGRLNISLLRFSSQGLVPTCLLPLREYRSDGRMVSVDSWKLHRLEVNKVSLTRWQRFSSSNIERWCGNYRLSD